MSSDAQGFAATVLLAFKVAGHHTDEEVGDAGGPSTTTMTKLRKVAEGDGEMPAPRGDTLRKIDRAADWASGSARSLWETGSTDGIHPVRAGLRSVLSGAGKSPGEVRRERQRAGLVGIDGYVERLADRLLEVEERLDILEQELREADERAVAKVEPLETHTDFPET